MRVWVYSILWFFWSPPRQRLLGAVSAYNSLPRRPHGLAPETLWRALRPLESQWRSKTIEAVAGTNADPLTDAEWLELLDEHAAADHDLYQKAAEKFGDDVTQLQKIFHSAQERAALAKKVNRQKQQELKQAPLVTGDIVLCKPTQYKSTAGFGKFETSSDGLRQYSVVSFSGGIATLQEITTGTMITRHESLLRIMPRVVQPGQCTGDNEGLPSPNAKAALKTLETLSRFFVLRTRGDGECLCRSLAMALQLQAGVKVHALEDNDARAAALREELVKFSKLYVQGSTADAAKMAATCLQVELEQETAWDASKPFTWERYWEFMSKPYSFATMWNVGRFVESSKLAVFVYTEDDKKVKLISSEDPPWATGQCHVLRTGCHYDLLVPRRIHSKQGWKKSSLTAGVRIIADLKSRTRRR